MIWLRLLTMLAALSLTGWAAVQLRDQGPGGVSWLPGCQFRRHTGLACPGCGMTRAAHAALNGQFIQAFKFNALGMVLLPVACIGLLPEAAAWVLNRPVRWRLKAGAVLSRCIVVSVIGFTVLRNINGWPWG